MSWITQWQAWRRRCKARRDAAHYEQERSALMRQIAHRKNARAEWKSKAAALQRATTDALRAERWMDKA